MKAVRIAALAAIMALLGCSSPEEETRVRFTAMGTLVEVTVFGHPPDDAHEAISEIEALFSDLENRWNPWEGGELAELNVQLTKGDVAMASRELAEILRRATELNLESDGLFEPSIGSLTRLWGFSSEESAPTAPPAGPVSVTSVSRHSLASSSPSIAGTSNVSRFRNAGSSDGSSSASTALCT